MMTAKHESKIMIIFKEVKNTVKYRIRNVSICLYLLFFIIKGIRHNNIVESSWTPILAPVSFPFFSLEATITVIASFACILTVYFRYTYTVHICICTFIYIYINIMIDAYNWTITGFKNVSISKCITL